MANFTRPLLLVVLCVLTIGGIFGESGDFPYLGTYELISIPGDPAYDAYLEALGVAKAFRQVMTRINVNIEIEKAWGDSYRYKVVTPLTTRETVFRFGEEIEDTYIDGRPYMTTFTAEGDDTVKQVLKFGNATGTSSYKFTSDNLIATLNAKDKVATRVYKRVYLV